MEIDISDFFANADPWEYSASQAERGANAGKLTWEAAQRDSQDFGDMLDTAEKLQAMRDHIKGFGAWDDAEIAAMDDTALRALLIQMIAGDIREGGLDALEPDWDEYERGAEAGRHSGNIYRADDGRVWYYVGD
jgi:hypothetical protein